jgi:hypothetical protein
MDLMKIGCEVGVDGAGSRSCSVAVFSISGVELSRFCYKSAICSLNCDVIEKIFGTITNFQWNHSI